MFDSFSMISYVFSQVAQFFFEKTLVLICVCTGFTGFSWFPRESAAAVSDSLGNYEKPVQPVQAQVSQVLLQKKAVQPVKTHMKS